jgi:DNA-binding CsgD family transcriptional regulator
MTLSEPVVPSNVDVDRLMDMAGVMRDLTRELRLMREIPAFLAGTLGRGPLTLALVKANVQGEPELIFIGCSAGEAAEEAASKVVLDIYRQLAQPGFSGQNLASLGATTQVTLPDSGVATVHQRQVDADHRLMMIVPGPSGSLDGTDLISLICNYLSRELRAVLMWESGPEQLGEPFARLTDREWVVLCGLNSEDGEKQLADRLGLSPHTLHSHIKSIYRKIAVQGRLPLLQKLNHAQCQYRMSILQPGADPLRVRVGG